MSGARGPWDLPPEQPAAAGATGGNNAATSAAQTPQTGVKAVNCPNCGGTVEIRAAGYTVNIVCQYCGSMLDVANPDVAIIERHNQAVKDLALPLGSKGWVKGHEYQLVGYMRRSIEGEGWDEYLLFNPYVGYRWLIFDENGWTFGTMLTSLPFVRGWSAEYAGVHFQSEDEEEWEAIVERVVGEFYWRVQRGDRAMLANFEGRGATLSRERVADEISWTVSETIGRGEMRGFGRQDAQDVAPASQETTGQSRFASSTARESAAPSTSGYDMFAKAQREPSGIGAYFTIAGIAFALMIGIMIVFAGLGNSRQSFTYQVPVDGGSESMTFGPLTFHRSSQRVVIDTRVRGLDNAYVESDISLVERTTQQSYNASGTVERYSGYDSDGSWTEGSESGSVKVAEIPAGTYDLVVESTANAWPSPRPGLNSVTVETGVSSGGAFFSNLVLAVLLLALPLIILVWRRFKG